MLKIKNPRYQVVGTFIHPSRPFSRPAHFSNKAVAIAFAQKPANGHTAVVIDRKLNKKIFTRALTVVR
jgi:ribosomal protein L31E